MERSHPYVNRIFHKSAEDLSDLPDSSVALTVTSPPYWNAIDYDLHSEDPQQYYRTRRYAQGYDQYGEYLTWLSRIMKGVMRKTVPGGFCTIVIGTVLLEGRHYPVPFDLVSCLCRDGWQFHQDIIWHKVTGGVKRAGVFIQKPYPGYFYPNIMTEYILIFQKRGDPIFKRVEAIEKEKARLPINRLFTTEVANSVWHIAPVPPGHLDHPCPFPEEIPFRLISLYSYPGDLVLDPFAGTGQTLKVARHLGRAYVGYETSERYLEYCLKRIQEPLAIREKQLIAVFEKISLDEARSGPARPGARTRYGHREPKAVR